MLPFGAAARVLIIAVVSSTLTHLIGRTLPSFAYTFIRILGRADTLAAFVEMIVPQTIVAVRLRNAVRPTDPVASD